ncbi:rhomboid family intramembrane serine protease [Halegenticoccus tardaugens]|uniref:rhomboid family intramembrane serine protease n=1 Tax=Halegenticoccus tardaugens TaxID=2071624 RepID=UPI00100A5A64|nr:rhomboid family intramembrane serine protease [Halegenticoccus tardaugens]
MAECYECGRYENLPYQCRRCGNTFCAEHRLPENHNCPGLQDWNDPGGVFGNRADDGTEQSTRARARDRVNQVTGTGGPLGYFRGNMTFVFLGLMWITFALQYFVLPLLGVGFRTPLWSSLFVLEPQNVAYVWTWVTSVFAHGGFTHIAVNSITLYFFGPVVERQLGSKRFTALFVGSGIVAGLAQIGTNLAMGGPAAGVLGASGAIMAIMGVLTVLNPNLRVYLYFFIPLPLWVLTFGFAAFSLTAGFGTFGGGFLGGNVAHFAHLAGLFIGLAYGQHIKGRQRAPQSLRFGRGGGPGGPRRRGPF